MLQLYIADARFHFFSDFSHNKIGDSGARAIGKLINGRCQLVHVNLLDNKIKSHGGKAIAHALGKNTTLRTMNVRLNRLGDDGGQAMCKALMKNTTLVELNLGSNDLGEPTAAALAQVSGGSGVVPPSPIIDLINYRRWIIGD